MPLGVPNKKEQVLTYEYRPRNQARLSITRHVSYYYKVTETSGEHHVLG